ncbi:MAG: dockerin type I domain-containing protein [Candidatus Zixiibacteriota bacterium]
MRISRKALTKILIFSFAVIFTCFFLFDFSYADPSTACPDTVYFEPVPQPRMSPDGDTFYVDPIGRDIKINVNLKNETDAIVSFVFPLLDRCYDGSSFLDPAKNNGSANPKCFEGSRVEQWGVTAINIELYPQIMLGATAMFAPCLPPGDGPVATLIFTAYDSGAICLDTCFYAMAPPITLVDTFSNGYTPVFFKETYQLRLCPYNPGDLNWDNIVDIPDVPLIVHYLFRGWEAPCPIKAADANCDQEVTIADAVYLVNYIFRSGPAPQICDY